jgi:DNA mismatch endonuclease (patch repair protein)
LLRLLRRCQKGLSRAVTPPADAGRPVVGQSPIPMASVKPGYRPVPSSEAVASRMSRQRRRETSPELAIRRLLFAAGYRYRLHYPVPARPRSTIDIAFTRYRVAVFVDGCFWHRCPEHGTFPRANAWWWLDKLERNVERDRGTDASLTAEGWQVIRVWEHEDPFHALTRIAEALDAAGCPVMGA